MESPLWLVKQGRRQDSDDVIKKMMKINGYRGDFDFLEINQDTTVHIVKETHAKQKRFRCRELLKLKEVRGNLIIMVI